MARGTETEVSAYEGEVESLTRPTPPVWASVSSSGRPTARGARSASPGPGRSTPTSLPPRWPTHATTPASPRPTPTSSWPCPTASRRWSSTSGTTAWAAPRWRRRSRWRSSSNGPPGRRPAGPAGLLRRLLRQPRRGGAGLHDRHLLLAPPHQCVALGGRHRRGGGRDTDGERVQRRPRAVRAGARRGDGRRRPPAPRAYWAPRKRVRPIAPWSSTRGWCRRCSGSSPRPCRARRS